MPVILFIIVSICGLRAEFHPSKVEIRVRVPADAFFFYIKDRKMTRDTTYKTPFHTRDTTRDSTRDLYSFFYVVAFYAHYVLYVQRHAMMCLFFSLLL